MGTTSSSSPPWSSSSSSRGGVQLSNWTLVFSDPSLEKEFRQQRTACWRSTELWRLKTNLLAGVINFSITIYLLSLTGNAFSKQGFYVVAPYMAVATLHYCLARWRQHCPRLTNIINHAAQACYSLICTLSMPTWVLHGDCVEPKVFWKKFILGSGILIGTWLGFLNPTFFTLACVLTPLQFAFQAWHLTQPTCADLTSSPQSVAMLHSLLQTLQRVASWSLHAHGGGAGGAPVDASAYDASTAPSGGVGAASSPGGAAAGVLDSFRVLEDPVNGCVNLMYLLQLFAGGTMLYVQYRMERAHRMAFLQGRKAQVQHSWPHVPILVQAVLHAVVVLQLFAVAWVVLQGAGANALISVSVGVPAPSAPAFAAGQLSY